MQCVTALISVLTTPGKMAVVATMGQQGNPAPVVKQPQYLELLLLSLYLAAGQPAGGARRRNQMMTMGRAKAKVCLLSAFPCFASAACFCCTVIAFSNSK